jgi:hypothetical protein
MSISSLRKIAATAQAVRQGVAAGDFTVRKINKIDWVVITDNTVGSSATARLIRETQE